MEAIFFDIKRFAVHDGPGIRTTFFMQGCPLRCRWCHNPESRSLMEDCNNHHFKTFRLSIAQLLNEAEKDRPFIEESGGGITFSGGEPTMQLNYLKKAAVRLKENGFHVALDTTGYFPEKEVRAMAFLFDLILIDIKHTDSKIHEKYTGVPNQTILKNLRALKKEGAEIRLRMPYLPGINNQPEVMQQVASLAQELATPLDVLPYHNTAGHKYQKLGLENNMITLSEPDEAELENTRTFFTNQNVEVKIGG